MAQPLVTGTSKETGILAVRRPRLAGALGVSESRPPIRGVQTLPPPPGKGPPSAKPGSRQTLTASPPSPGAPVVPMLCPQRRHQNFPGPGPPPGPWRPAGAIVRVPQDRSPGAGGWRRHQCKRWKDEILRPTGTRPPASRLPPQAPIPAAAPVWSVLHSSQEAHPGPCQAVPSWRASMQLWLLRPRDQPYPLQPPEVSLPRASPWPWFSRRCAGG